MSKLKNFFVRNRKLLSVFFSVAFSVLIVAVLVHGSTTIGLDVVTGGGVYATGSMAVDSAAVFNGNVDLGDAVTDSLTISAYLDAILHSSSSLLVSGEGGSTSTSLMPWTNNTYDLGFGGSAWRDIWASGTFYGAVGNFNGSVTLGDDHGDTIVVNSTTTLTGTQSDLVVQGVSTSTFAGDLSIAQSSATTTVHVGEVGTAGAGGCFSIVADDGVAVYLYFTNDGGKYELATSTTAADCY